MVGAMVGCVVVLLAVVSCHLVHGYSADPNFPDGVGAIVSSIKTKHDEAEALIPADDQKLASLVNDAHKALEESLAAEMSARKLAQAATNKVGSRVLKHKFVGGCPRTFTGCPEGWTRGSGRTCQPPGNYDGVCSVLDLMQLQNSQLQDKENMAVKCRMMWPCTSSCKRDFGGCPETWSHRGGLCVAPSSFSGGICGPSMEFTDFTQLQKMHWAEMCGASWPCKS